MPVKSPALLRRRAIATASAVALLTPAAIVGLGAGSASAKTHHYPKAARKAFITNCVKSATAGGNVSKKKATTYCTSTLNCIEAHLTLKQFVANPSAKVVTRCEKAAIKKITG